MAIAYTLQYVIDDGLKKSNFSATYYDWHQLYQSKINADVIIQGSSRARTQISPKAFEDHFKLSTFNLGMDGTSFPLENYRFKEYLKYNNKPKYIIQVIDAQIFAPVLKFDNKQFIPYLNAEALKHFGDSATLKTLDIYLPLYKYIHFPGAVDAGLTHFFSTESEKTNNYKGYQSFDKPYASAELAKVLRKYPKGFTTSINKQVWADFIHFIQYCKQNSIRLILVYTPVYKDYQRLILNSKQITSQFATTASRYGIEYLDYSQDSIGADSSLFFDYYHLNKKGVTLFNNRLVRDLEKRIY